MIILIKGASEPLVGKFVLSTWGGFGTDGLGDGLPLELYPGKRKAEHEHAVNAIIRKAHELQGQVSNINYAHKYKIIACLYGYMIANAKHRHYDLVINCSCFLLLFCLFFVCFFVCFLFVFLFGFFFHAKSVSFSFSFPKEIHGK